MERWFRPSPEVDAEIGARFGDEIERALAGELDAWAQQPRGRLALVILLDQFTRNLGRGTSDAFRGDARALALAGEAVARGVDRSLQPSERSFLYMPFMHAEDAAAQERCVEVFSKLVEEAPASAHIRKNLEVAIEHKRVIDRFGRFPHRNDALGRSCSREEERYLAEGGGFW